MKNFLKKLSLATLLLAQSVYSAEVVTDVLRLTPSTIPGTGRDGQLRVDSTSKKLKKYNATTTAWAEISGSGGGSGKNYLSSNPDAEVDVSGYSAFQETDSVTFTDAGDTVNLTSHGLSNNQAVAFTSITSTTGISTHTLYYVVGATANTFQVATTVGGSAIALTTNGSGTLVRSIPKTAGTANSPTLTITRTTTTPLRDIGSFLITKDANDRMGQGVVAPFTIDKADQGKVLNITFDYDIGSGTYAGGTDTTLGDLNLYIYDVTNGVLIQPTGYKIPGSVSGVEYKHLAQFQSATNSTSYRLVWIVSSVSTTAWTFKYDTVVVGPQTVSFGAPVGDWTSFPLTIGGSSSAPTPGTSTSTAFYRRVGDSMQIRYIFSQTGSGSAGSGSYLFPLPVGAVIDTSKASVSTNGSGATASAVGVGYAGNVSGASSQSFYQAYVVPYNTTNLVLVPAATDVAVATVLPVGSTKYALSGSTIYYAFDATVPILGWGSSVAMSSDTDTRAVAFEAYRSANQTSVAVNNSAAKILYETVVKDSHGAFSTTNNRYTAPLPGWYVFSGSVDLAGANVLTNRYDIRLYINGVAARNGPNFTEPTSGTASLQNRQVTWAPQYLNAGDYVELFLFGSGDNSSSNITINGGQAITWFGGFRLTGPASIAATDTVAARYYGVTASLSTSTSKATYTTKDYDTHGAYVSGVYTVPVRGRYQINAQLYESASYGVDSYNRISILVNSVEKSSLRQFAGGSQSVLTAPISDTLYLNAGDTVQINSDNNGTSPTIGASNVFNFFSIIRVGL